MCTILGTLSGAGLTVTAGQVSTIQSGLLGISSLVFLGISVYGSWQANSKLGISAAAQKNMTPAEKTQIAASVPGTTVVTSPAIAALTPEMNIKSNLENKVVPTAAASLGASQ